LTPRRLGWVVALAVAACGRSPAAPPPPPTPPEGSWPEADRLFHVEPRWLGGDAAYSIDLGGDRSLWLFGDSFVTAAGGGTRRDATMVHNSAAIQRGRDPTSATLAFALPAGAPRSFFAEDGARWHWPAGGVRLASGPLVVFLWIVESSDAGLGFASAGWRVARVDAPDDDPSTWKTVLLDPPPQAFDAVAGSAITLDGSFVVSLATRFEGTHAGFLARFRQEDLAAGLVAPEWWSGAARGWTAAGLPEAVIDDAGNTEGSLHFDARSGRWVHVASRGFGATTIAVRTAPALEGPWSAPQDVFSPPESSGTHPFVYAGKAHPEVDGEDPSLLVVTYATNSFDFGDLFAPSGETSLYWPRFARVRVR
jgi:hypothetical protein